MAAFSRPPAFRSQLSAPIRRKSVGLKDDSIAVCQPNLARSAGTLVISPRRPFKMVIDGS